MSVVNFPELKDKYEIQVFEELKRVDMSDSVAFTGSPRKHPFKANRVILIADPFTQNTHYYEFNTKDIVCAKELPNIIDENGNSVNMIRLWAKKKSIALRCIPFVVDHIPIETV